MEKYTFNLSNQEAKLLLDILGQLPAKDTGSLYLTILNQAQEQETKNAKPK